MTAQRKTKPENNIVELASKTKKKRESRPASNPEAREQQLVSLAVDLAEKQLRDGTASPSVINHFLKIASTRETIEREMMQKQAKLLEAKTTSMSREQDNEAMTKKALDAMKSYSGSKD